MQRACLAGEIYAKLERVWQRIGILDTGIAAISIQEGFTLVTSKTSHFQRIKDLGYPLQFENWRDA
jgi:predicted nucleic acid-binding protein